jgi:hypothetical protein
LSKLRDAELFDEAVARFFRPFAQKHNFSLSKVREGVYDIFSPFFIMRVRLDTGHRRGLNVLLRPSTIRAFDENVARTEYGIANFVRFQGGEWKEGLIDTDIDFMERAEWLGCTSEKFGLPYLLGQKNDFDSIKTMVELRTKNDTRKINKYDLPQMVRKKWRPKSNGQ